MNTNETTGLAVAAKEERFTLAPRSLDEAMQYSRIMAQSALVPESFRGKPADILVAVMAGAELGVSPLQALSGIAVINGKATVWGDLLVAVVQATGELEYLKEEWDPAADGGTAIVTLKRKGQPERVERFSMKDAERAKLAGKQTYQQWPQRMCGWRAKTFALRAEFADALKGMTTAEEAQDVIEGEYQPVAMPRRASEVNVTAVDSFLADSGKAPAGAARPQAASSGGATSSSGKNVWEGVIAGVSEKSGKTQAGKAWTLNIVSGEDGTEFGTFDKKIRDGCAFLAGQRVRVEWEPSPNGKSKNIISVDPVADDAVDEPGATG